MHTNYLKQVSDWLAADIARVGRRTDDEGRFRGTRRTDPATEIRPEQERGREHDAPPLLPARRCHAEDNLRALSECIAAHLPHEGVAVGGPPPATGRQRDRRDGVRVEPADDQRLWR